MMKAGMRDVDDVEHAEGDRDADRDGGVEAAEQHAGDDGVEQKVHGDAHGGSTGPRWCGSACATHRRPPGRTLVHRCGGHDASSPLMRLLQRACIMLDRRPLCSKAGGLAIPPRCERWRSQTALITYGRPREHEDLTHAAPLIIGGSMSGLFSALYLRRRGWNVDVYERSPVPLTGRGAGIMTHPEMRGGAGELGLDTRRDFGVPVEGRVVLDIAGAEIGRHDRRADRHLLEPAVRDAGRGTGRGGLSFGQGPCAALARAGWGRGPLRRRHVGDGRPAGGRRRLPLGRAGADAARRRSRSMRAMSPGAG